MLDIDKTIAEIEAYLKKEFEPKKPTTLIYRPADLKLVGLTPELVEKYYLEAKGD